MNIKKIWFLVSFVCLAEGVQAQYSNLKFEHFSTMEGLSSSTCVEIFQDSEGFLWFGTIDGLNKYDGYGFVVYRPILNDPTSISNNRINAIVEDKEGRLWVGTSNGLNVFIKGSERFIRLNFGQSRKNAISGRDIVNDLFYDEMTNMLWVATREGVSKLDLNTAGPSFKNTSFVRYEHSPEDATTIDNNDVTSIHKDHENRIWLVTAGKYLNRYNPDKDNFERTLIDIPSPYELDHIPKAVLIDKEGDFWIGNDLSRLILWDREAHVFRQVSLGVQPNVPIFDLYQDRKGVIWVATDGYGIFFLDKEKGITKHLTHNLSDPYSLPNNQPSKILEGKDGIFWIATYNKGVSKLALAKSAFGHYFHQPGNDHSLSTKIAQSVMQDSKKRIWVGTDGGGLNLLHEKNGTVQYFRNSPDNPSSLSSDKILYLLESADGKVWVCTWDGGLNKFDPEAEKATRYKHNPRDPFSIGQNTVWCAAEDSLNRLWLGTQAAGLNLFDPVTEKFHHFKHNPEDTSSLINNFVFSLFIDTKNRLLVGTSLGLSVADLGNLKEYVPKDMRFYEPDVKDIQGNRINYITEDHYGNIWVGTDLGLHKLSAHLKLIKSYSTRDGLPNNLIVGITEDARGHMWITTKSGLSRLDPQTNEFKNFNVHDGVQGMEFQSKSIDKTLDGRILIGGINGLNVFDPRDIKPVTEDIKPIITAFKLFNQPIRAGDTVHNRVLLKQHLSRTKEIELKYNEAYITFEFVALYYQNPERVQYAYCMRGLDNDLILAGANKIANYSSLPPGDYTFEVRASVNGAWEDVPAETINILVLPPPWKTWWAYTLYVIFAGLAFWVAIRYYTKIVKEEKEHELDQMKLNFFINVSHEFRTPLTLILNPIDKILSFYNDPEEVKSSAQTIQRSAKRLLNLINQLLDFRKMDLGKAPLEPVKGDMVKFTKDIFMLFEDLAKVKDIHFYFNCSLNALPAWFDPDKVEKIITNILSNALKFTEPGGAVTLSVSKVNIAEKPKWTRFFKKKRFSDFVEIKVTDTGVGFKQEQLKDVFKRFMHIDRTKTGTGIGLNFTKSLVELHGGEIYVESEYGSGSTFTVRLPIEEQIPEALRAPEAAPGQHAFDLNSVKSAEYEIAISGKNKEEEGFTMQEEQEAKEIKRPLALIVEDNRELRVHLKNELKHHFKVREAVNGAEGLEKVHKHYPDIVISDVMMPEMDGFELCRRIKTEIETCHIPVILLTARSLEEDRIEGYNTGADEYLPKPFNIHVLRARIKNLLEAKNRLREKFTSIGGVLPSSELTTNTLDEVFLDKATKVVLDNVSDPDFNLDTLLTEIGVSRSQFYRKINSLTGQNPSNFIRTIRLKYASELLMQKQYSIKEVAAKAGFNSSAYFSKTFRELFGKTPNQFMEQKFQEVN